MSPRLRVLADAPAVAEALAADLTARAVAAVNARGRCVGALAGGTSPAFLYRRLAAPDGPYEPAFPWDQTLFLLGDERCVPAEDPLSNRRLIRDAFAGSARAARAVLLAPDCGGGPPDQARAAYERRLRAALGGDPTLDWVLLGLGEDGHTASLFPGDPALATRTAWVALTHSAATGTDRISLTLPLINAARAVLFLVTGTAKARVLAQVFGAPPDPALPATLVQSAGELSFYVDQAAAAALLPGTVARSAP